MEELGTNTIKNIGNIIKSLQNIMRKDQGVSGDAQRIEQLGWMISLKIIDDKDAEMELLQEDYISPIPEELKWLKNKKMFRRYLLRQLST